MFLPMAVLGVVAVKHVLTARRHARLLTDAAGLNAGAIFAGVFLPPSTLPFVALPVPSLTSTLTHLSSLALHHAFVSRSQDYPITHHL
jgi:hypothetical protein